MTLMPAVDSEHRMMGVEEQTLEEEIEVESEPHDVNDVQLFVVEVEVEVHRLEQEVELPEEAGNDGPELGVVVGEQLVQVVAVVVVEVPVGHEHARRRDVSEEFRVRF